jgi:hypothetical protein
MGIASLYSSAMLLDLNAAPSGPMQAFLLDVIELSFPSRQRLTLDASQHSHPLFQ